jgi:alpha-1,6-mannosyltransferase
MTSSDNNSIDQYATRLRQLVRSPEIQLIVLAVLSLGLYGLALVLPYNIFDLWQRGRINLGAATAYKPEPMAQISLVLAGCSLAYWLALRITKSRSSRTLWGIVIGSALAFNIALLFIYPIGANDLFDYIFRGRIQTVYHENPYYVTPSAHPDDPFSKYAFWQSIPSSYGPLWEIAAAGASLVAGDDIVTNVLVYKLEMILASILLTAIVGWGMHRQHPELTLHSVTLLAWNPLVIYSAAGHGHNDALMAMFVALGCVLLLERHYTLAAIAQTAGALVKFIPALIVPVIVVAALKTMHDWKSRIRYLIVTGAACGALVIVAYLPYFQGGDILSFGRRTTLITTSIGSLLQMNLQESLGLRQSQTWVSALALAVLGTWIAYRLLVLWYTRGDDRDAPLRESLGILLFYLLVSCTWFQPWYLLWPLAIAALLPGSFIADGTVIYSLIALWKFPIFHFLIVRGRTPRPDKQELEVGMTLLIHGPMWIYFLLGEFMKRRKSDTNQHVAVDPI